MAVVGKILKVFTIIIGIWHVVSHVQCIYIVHDYVVHVDVLRNYMLYCHVECCNLYTCRYSPNKRWHIDTVLTVLVKVSTYM